MCSHLKYLRNEKQSSFKAVKESYILLHAFFVKCTYKGSSKKNTLKTSCYVCKKFGVGARLHACLSCVFIGCLKDHFEGHEGKNQEKHKFAMDLFFGSIYCFECKDYVSDEYFSGRIKETIPWLPTKGDSESFKTHRPAKMNQSLVGLRGLWNMGLTCYINCIIQIFANTPMMRNYFLSGRHLCHLEKDDCQACLLSEIFQELYSGKKDPLPLQKLVYDSWRKNKIFCGRDGNDAQEFYAFYLEELHKYCKEEDPEDMKEKSELPILNHEEDSTDFDIESQKKNPPNNQGYSRQKNVIENAIGYFFSPDSKPCRCVIHQIFSGKYQNVRTCNNCGVLSSTNLESWNITLHFGDSAGQAKLTDLIEKCIERTEQNFTVSDEKSGITKTSNITCRSCKDGIESEQFLFKVLPNILCFHFPHKKEKKKVTQIIFPEYLDMSSYTPETAKSATLSENGAHSFKKYQSSKNMYILYAIVCHKGDDNDGGHYYSYVRKNKDMWYICNDDVIEPVEFKVVSECSGTLFFYIKEVLEYEKTSLRLNENERNNSVHRNNHVNGYS